MEKEERERQENEGAREMERRNEKGERARVDKEERNKKSLECDMNTK